MIFSLKSSEKSGKLFCAILVAGLAVLLFTSGTWAEKLRPEMALYDLAKKDYYIFINSKFKREYRHNWINIIGKFTEIWKRYPHSAEAAKALFTAAKLHHRFYLEHKGEKNLNRALFYYRKVVSNFTDNPLADDALFQEGDIFLRKKNYTSAQSAFERIVKNFPLGDQSGPAQKKLQILLSLTDKHEQTQKIKASGGKKAPVKTANRRNRRPLIVVDPGHGGKDAGARSKKGLLEKHVNLAISKRLKRILESKYNYRVIMTREGDSFIPLEKRGAIANRNNADLFVSIHANAARREGANGIETYHLGRGSSERARETAARENGEKVYSIPDSQVQRILADMITTQTMNNSSCLATFVQETLTKGMIKKYPAVKDLGVKDGPFYVLHDTKMASILVEVGFLTNRKEQRRLARFDYLDRLAGYIARGIHFAMPIEKCVPTI